MKYGCRHGNTASEIKNDNRWAKVGKQHYINSAGVEVKYDCNAWLWRVNKNLGYTTLWAAKSAAEAIKCNCLSCNNYPYPF